MKRSILHTLRGRSTWLALAWAAGITLVFAPLATTLYRRSP